MHNYKNTKQHLLTFNEVEMDESFPYFSNDKDRIKYMRNAYKNLSLTKAFSVYYNLELNNDTKSNKSINNVINIEIGQVVNGTVEEITPTQITFSVPGVKEEIIARENFSSCIENVQQYLLTHNNKLLFEVREKKNNKYYVSVINAYYKTWVDRVKKAIQYEEGINVHIDSLVPGGYICHTSISNLNELTGKNYTHSVFIPGSHIVLNIEHDFDKWIGEDVIIVPQKFVEYHTDYVTGETENSLVGSRKRVLQILGTNNLADLYHTYLLSKKENVSYNPEIYDGTVTGIINSQKKTGIFVELDGKYITGLVPVDASELLDYKPNDKIKVKIKEFEIQEGKDPFIYNKKSKIVKCNTRAIFEIV